MKYFSLFLIILLCMVNIAYSEDEISIATSVYTKHLNGDKNLNENTQGVAIYYNDWLAGTFNNSNYQRSWILARRFSTDKYDLDDNLFIRGNFYAGALYGYGDYMPNISGWTVGATPSFEIGYKKIALETMISPAGGGVISSLIKFTF